MVTHVYTFATKNKSLYEFLAGDNSTRVEVMVSKTAYTGMTFKAHCRY